MPYFNGCHKNERGICNEDTAWRIGVKTSAGCHGLTHHVTETETIFLNNAIRAVNIILRS